MYRNRQARFFEPQVEMIQPTALDLEDNFIRRWVRLRQFSQLKCAWRAMSGELEGFHGPSLDSKIESPRLKVEGFPLAHDA